MKRDWGRNHPDVGHLLVLSATGNRFLPNWVASAWLTAEPQLREEIAYARLDEDCESPAVEDRPERGGGRGDRERDSASESRRWVREDGLASPFAGLASRVRGESA